MFKWRVIVAGVGDIGFVVAGDEIVARNIAPSEFRGNGSRSTALSFRRNAIYDDDFFEVRK